jgi:hypothetical protein
MRIIGNNQLIMTHLLKPFLTNLARKGFLHILIPALVLFVALPVLSFAETYVFDTATSSTTWNVPADVTEITVKVWGGGGGYSKITFGESSPTPATHTTDDIALLDNHSSRQAGNQFVACTTKYNASLFKFQLTNNSSTDVTVDEVIFQLSSITGIVNGDLSDLRIYDDTNSQDAAPSFKNQEYRFNLLKQCLLSNLATDTRGDIEELR